MLWATHLSEILLEMPELQTLFKFLLMLCPELIKGSLGFIQLGQEPRKEERHLGQGRGCRAWPVFEVWCGPQAWTWVGLAQDILVKDQGGRVPVASSACHSLC